MKDYENKDNEKDIRKKKPERDREPIDDFSDILNQFFGNFGNIFNFDPTNIDPTNKINPTDPNIHSSSISFAFGTGMNKPDVRINGKPVDEETLKRFLNGKPPMGFSPNNGIPIDSNIKSENANGQIDPNSLPDFIKNMMGLGGKSSIPEIDASKLRLDDGSKAIENIGEEHSSEENIGEEKEFEEPIAELNEDKNGKFADITLELPGIKKEDIILTYTGTHVLITTDSYDRVYKKAVELKFEPNKDLTEITGNNGIYQITFKK